MRQHLETLIIATRGPGLHDFTAAAQSAVARSGIRQGLLTLFIRHTSASLLVQENADPDVLKDLQDFLVQLVPHDESLYRHNTEGPDDMPAHIRSALTATSLSIPFDLGEMVLGTWQALYLFEHRNEGSKRNVVAHVVGE